jgi:hypothetical protein
MKRRRSWVVGVGLLALLAAPVQAGHGGVSIGIGIGAPVFYHPYYAWYPYPYYRPYPVYVEPVPVVVASPVVQPVPVHTVPATPPTLETAPTPRPITAADTRQADISRNLQQLNDPDEHIRAESVIQLGRLKAEKAIDPIAATLTGDGSPTVREAAARSLGLIGSPKALLALEKAAHQDSDRDVRRSAQFAVDIIQTSGR